MHGLLDSFNRIAGLIVVVALVSIAWNFARALS